MTLSSDDLGKLKALAEAATPGPWEADGVLLFSQPDCDLHPVADFSCNHTCRIESECIDNALFAAATNPATVLALIAEIEALRPAQREAQPEPAPEGQAEGVATNLDRVREFHETFGVPVLSSPCIPADRVNLRLDILDEERRELSAALEAGDVVEVADALTDMAYLIYGTALEFGIDLNACFAEVHRSNMSKLGADGKPIYRVDGKVLKGPNYSPPDLIAALSTSKEPG